jgi:chemotaxis family two-component system sensor kinase Cph1
MAQDRQELREFLFRACHDLRAPLRAVRANTELLLKAPEKREGPEFEQIMGFIANGATKADSLVDALSNYALALSVQPNRLPVSTDVLLRNVLLKMEAEIRGSDAEITHDDLPRLTGDPDRLMQLFENLLRNAIQQRGDAAPRIHISASQRDREWIFAVRDNGPGIEAEDLERIFRPFERLRRERGGAGLGLTVCREIVAGHGGRIWVESVVGDGATVYFTVEIVTGSEQEVGAALPVG